MSGDAGGPDDLRAAKADLRRKVLAARRELSAEERRDRSDRIARRVYALEAWRRAGIVHLYVGALDGEVETREIAHEAWLGGKRVACPVVRWDPPRLDHHEIGSLGELAVDSRGMWEPDPSVAPPVDPAAIDLVVAPGLAFDREGNRIGFGAGFYDRFLASIDAPAVALAYSLQVFDAVPHGEHDVPVDWIVTENETIDCRSSASNTGRRVI